LLAQREAHGIRHVPVRHEAAGVHMAEGLYKTTGKVAAVLPGPGSANLLAGVVTALHYVFGLGPTADQVRSEADVILIVGSRVGNLGVPYDKYWGDADGQRVIQVDIDPRHLGGTRPASLAVPSDARAAGRRRQLLALGVLRPAPDAPTLLPLDPRAGNARHRHPLSDRRQARRGHREVVCLTGDGAAGFSTMEMQSAAREKLAITTIVFAEGSWTMEQPNELALYGKTFGTRKARSAGTSSPRASAAATASTSTGSRTSNRRYAAPSNTIARASSACAPTPTRTSRSPELRDPRGRDGPLVRGLRRPHPGQAASLGGWCFSG
jgi:thiamine pyrophosphate-dependent acetolactate synthase large subunit-like protein